MQSGWSAGVVQRTVSGPGVIGLSWWLIVNELGLICVCVCVFP